MKLLKEVNFCRDLCYYLLNSMVADSGLLPLKYYHDSFFLGMFMWKTMVYEHMYNSLQWYIKIPLFYHLIPSLYCSTATSTVRFAVV